MTGSLPRNNNNYNISDPDMIASKLAEQEYLQSLGKTRIEYIRDLERKSFEQILLVFYTKLLYLFCLRTTDSIHIRNSINKKYLPLKISNKNADSI